MPRDDHRSVTGTWSETAAAAASDRSSRFDLSGCHLRARLRARMFGVSTEGVELGRFSLLERIGAGGMGVVYAAHDRRLDRKVAVKILDAERRGDERHRVRLLREAQALARLSHPNVVQIFDVGTFEGHVYLAMELLEGPSLRAWTEERSRAWRQIVDKYVQAGRGLQAAHDVGILHRDFKPANALMGRDGRVRVLDFGLARKLEDDSSLIAAVPGQASASGSGSIALDESVTRSGELMGTPAYMSPEQIAGHPLDVRSDQFSFCVALYEALFGRRPHQGVGAAEIMMSISDGVVMPPPSGASVPRRIRLAILRGLQTEPARRFPSMNALVDELEAPDRRWYRLGLGATLVVGSLGTGVWASGDGPCRRMQAQMTEVWNGHRAGDLRDRFVATGRAHAASAATRAIETLDAHAEAWSAARIEACETRRSDEMLETGFEARTADLVVTCLQRNLRQFETIVSMLSEADGSTVDGAHRALEELPGVETCAPGAATVSAPPPHLVPLVQEIEQAIDAAAAHRATGHAPLALGIADRAVRAAERIGYDPTLARARMQHAIALDALERMPEAAAEYEDVAVAAQGLGLDALAGEAFIALVRIRGRFFDDLEGALRTSRRARAIIARLEGEPLMRAKLLHHEGLAFQWAEQYERSVEAFGESIGILETLPRSDVLRVSRARADLARSLQLSGEVDRALEIQLDVLETMKEQLGAEHPEVGEAHFRVALVLGELGRRDDAREHYGRALDILTGSMGPRAPRLAELHLAIADLAIEQEDYRGARRHARQGLDIRTEAEGPDAPRRAEFLAVLAQAHDGLGQDVEALQTYQRFIAHKLGLARPSVLDRWGLAAAQLNAGSVAHRLGREALARRLLDAAVTGLRELGSQAEAFLLEALRERGELALRMGELEAAETDLAEAVVLAAKHSEPVGLGRAQFARARTWWRQGTRRREALRLAREAEVELAKAAPRSDAHRSVQQWLEEHDAWGQPG